jgi:putative YphP/YqiW family bacilliredoxin
MYPEELVAPMRKELTDVGFVEMKTAEEVDNILGKNEGSTLVLVNSVCGCAAANARPAVIASMKNGKTPDNFTTVFAGQDGEATAQARKYMLPFPASSPSIALFKNGELVHFLERHHIEGREAGMIASNLMDAFNEL